MDYTPLFKTKPYKHQLKEFEENWRKPARALIWQMRSGKSKSMVDLACRLWHELEIDGVLVIAPNNVHLNWGRRELVAHCWDSVPYQHFVWDSGKSSNVNYDISYQQFLQDDTKLSWYMVNCEGLGLDKARKYLAQFVRSRRRLLVIVDEVHEFRWPSSKRYFGAMAIVHSPRCAYRRILSANPIDNSPLHAFAEFNLLQKGAMGFEKYEDFKERYGIEEDIYVPGGFSKSGVKKQARKRPAIVGYQNLDELQAKIASWSSLVLRSEIDDMPELLPGRVDFEMTRAQKDLHNALVRGTLARLDSGELIKPEEGGVLVIRLQQIASGFVVDEDGGVHDIMPPEENPRLQALWGELRLAPGKCIIWCRFREDVVRVTAYLNNKLGKSGRAVDYYGGTSKRNRVKHEEAFRSDPKTIYLVGQYQAGGQGLDFSAAEDIFWYSQTSDLLKRRQADERATKIGGKKIGLTDLVAAGSNDQKLLDELADRTVRADYLTGSGLRRYLEIIH